MEAVNGPTPLWSVLIPTYNSGEELSTALRSVLDQDPGPHLMQIEVVDNCSDKTDIAEVVRGVGAGRVAFHRNERNLGMAGNFNRCVERARGRLVHLLHADDWVLPGFYTVMADLFVQYPELGMGFCRHYYAAHGQLQDESLSPLERPTAGILENWLDRLAVQQRIQYVAAVVRRDIYQNVGPFLDMPTCEDWDMWMRIARDYPVGFVPTALAAYRIHTSNLSLSLRQDGREIRYARETIRRFHAWLPPARRRQLSAQALQRQAKWALTLANGFAGQGNLPAARANLGEAFGTSAHPRLWTAFGTAILRLLWHTARTQILPSRPPLSEPPKGS